MNAIPIYAKDCSDFSTNGLCLLQPVECIVEETANGLYELTMELAIDDGGRFSLVVPGTVVKVITPARESPLYEMVEETVSPTTQTVVTKKIYKVNTSSGRLRLRQKPSPSGKVLSKWKKGTEVTLLSSADAPWYKVSIVKGGATGYMHSQYLRFSRNVTETITKSRPVTQKAVQVEIAREQLFRVYSVENDTAEGIQTVRALHIFYDLRWDFLNATYAPANAAAAAAAEYCFTNLRYVPEHALYAALTGSVSGEYSWKNFTEILLDPDTGIVPQANGCIFRDNFDAYLLPDQERDMGVTVRRGKNLAGVTVTTDDSEVVTRIQPRGKDKDGNNIFITGSVCVDSPKIADYPVIRAQMVDYDITFDNTRPTSAADHTYNTRTEFDAALRAAAQADFAAGCDQPSYGLEVDFVLLENTAGYEDYARLQAVHLFDSVTVIDELIGLTARLRVTSYKWNVLSEQYEAVTLGDIQDMKQTTYSFNLAGGSVSGDKIQHGTGSTGTGDIAAGAVTADKLANGSVTPGKLAESTLLVPYPIGSIYASASNTNPSGSFGGTWTAAGTTTVGTTTVYYWQRTA